MSRLVEFATSLAQTVDSDFRKPAWRVKEFGAGFDHFVSELKMAYRIDNDVFSQESRISRFQRSESINSAETFLRGVQFNPRLITDIVEKESKILNNESVVELGDFVIGAKKIAGLRADSSGYLKPDVVSVLAHGAAKLEMLLEGGDKGIPDAYATAIGHTRKELSLIKDAAKLAYDWNPSWGRLNVENVINKARTRFAKNTVKKGVVVGALAMAACGAKMPTDASPTFDLQLPDGGGIATEVVDIASPIAVVPTEIAIGLGGELTKAQKEFAESKMGVDMKKALTDYVNEYWVKVDPKSFAPGTEVSLIPLINPNDPSNPENMTFVGEVNTGDSNYDGYVFMLPYKQYLKYLETGDPQYMIYPQDVSTLQDGTDPFKVPKQITEGQDASKKALDSGIPVGAVLGLDKDNHFVYYASGSNGGYAVVGELDANLQYLAYPKYDAQTLAGMTPEQVKDSVSDIEGYEKKYQEGGLYVYYVNPNGELGAAYNLETGEMVEMPENLKTLKELPTKIENAESYPEVDVKDLPAFVAWIHFHYDAQAKDLQPYPFVEKILTPGAKQLEEKIGWGVFFSEVKSMDRYALFPGMVKIMDGNDPIFWGFPRLIKDGSGNSRLLLASDAWDEIRNDPNRTNDFYYRLTSNPALRDKWQIAKFSDNSELACDGYQQISPSNSSRREMCSLYMKKYYNSVKREVARIIATGIYSSTLEGIPVFMTEDTTSFHVGN